MQEQKIQKVSPADMGETYKSDSLYLMRDIIQDCDDDKKPLVRVGENLYQYQGICYNMLSDRDIEGVLLRFLTKYNHRKLWKTSKINEIKKALPHMAKQVETLMDSYSDKICVKNGIIIFEESGFKLVEHSHKYYFSTYVDVDYDAKAQIPVKFLEFLGSLFTNEKGDVDSDSVNSLLSLGGLLIFPKVKVKKMFMFVGEGANGKSILLNLYKKFFPPEAVTSLSLQALSSEGHMRSDIVRSRLNLTAEAKSNAVDSEEIKKVVSGEGITINPKHAHPFTFYPHTKILIATNTKPYFNDTTYAIFRRIHMFEFKNRFMEDGEYKLEKDPQESRIFKARDEEVLEAELESELSGILNLFLESLMEIRKNNWQFAETENSILLKEEYKKSSDPLGTWLKENYEVDVFGLSKVGVRDLYDRYEDYYHNELNPNKPLAIGMNSFSTKIKELFRIESRMVRDKGKTFRAYTLQLRNKKDDELEQVDGSQSEVGRLAEDTMAELGI